MSQLERAWQAMAGGVPVNRHGIDKADDARKHANLELFNEEWAVFDIDFHKLCGEML